ncbi:MAG: hypothetical protein ACNYNX_04435 [Leucobacter sp.]
MTRRILCISLSPIYRDARVLRQLGLLSEFGEVTTIGFGDKPEGAAHHIQVPDGLASLPQTLSGVVKLGLRAHRSAECSAPAAKWVLSQNVEGPWDLVVANDARVLDLASRLAGDAPIWADLHEWAPEEQSHITSWRLLVGPFMTHLCRRYLPQAALVTTVSQGIADLYLKIFGAPALMMANSGVYREISPGEAVPGRVACVHSGAAVDDRGIGTMIEVFTALPEQFTLDLYLVPGGDGGAHLRELKKIAAGCDRIRFRDPVQATELPDVLSKYDLGVHWIPANLSTNTRLALPNKFFDYVQARIGIAIGPSEEMVRELRKYDLGVVAESFDPGDLRRSMLALDADQLNAFKGHAGDAARALSFEVQAAPVRERLRQLLAN